MNKQIWLLVDIQALDTEIIDKDIVVASIPSRITAAQDALKETQASLDSTRDRFGAAEKKKKDSERELEVVTDKLNKLKGRSSDIKTNKEYQAHLKEIESVQQELSDLEDVILTIMEDMDSEVKVKKAAEDEYEQEKQKVEAIRAELDQQVAKEKKALSELKQKRAGLADSIDKDLYDFYMSLLQSKGGLAVVQVRDFVCQGCNMNIPPQLFVEIKRNEGNNQCPQCNRLLFFKEPEAE